MLFYKLRKKVHKSNNFNYDNNKNLTRSVLIINVFSVKLVWVNMSYSDFTEKETK